MIGDKRQSWPQTEGDTGANWPLARSHIVWGVMLVAGNWYTSSTVWAAAGVVATVLTLPISVVTVSVFHPDPTGLA